MTTKHYPELEANPNFPALEEEVLTFWKASGIFEKSVEARPEKTAEGASNAYVFYDGPPFANGSPHYGHLLTGYVKDAIARYHTMKGKRVERRFGWDCHGLPAEMGAEKELGISGRAAIAAFGIGKFNEHCRTSVMKYTQDWEYYVTRQGRWVDFANDYKTMDTPYMESCLWAFKELYTKGLVYESMRVMPYSWAAETPVSNFETRIDNATREREDKAAYVKFRLKYTVPSMVRTTGGVDCYIIAWTTTPWTLPSNLALAAGNVNYVASLFMNENKQTEAYICAESVSEKIFKELGEKYVRMSRAVPYRDNGEIPKEVFWNIPLKKDDLIGLEYEPLFPYFADTPNAFRVLDGSEFVTDGDGTGIVHLASGFGEVDQKSCAENGIETLVPVDEKGRFTSEIYDLPWHFTHPPEIAKDNFGLPLAGGSACGAVGAENEKGRGGAAAVPPASGRSNPPLRIWEGVGTHPDSTRNPTSMEHAKDLRANQTEAEHVLWEVLSASKLQDKKFRRQHAMGAYIVDFVCTSANLVIELDGGQHAEQQEYDAKRTEYLESQHYRVLRFWNNEVLENLEGVVAAIEQALMHPPEIAKGDFDLPPAGGGSQAAPPMLSLQGLLVVPDTRIAEADIVVSEEDIAQHIAAKDVAKYGLANMRIVRWLKANNKLVKDEPCKHNYPHCWRTDTPLIYRAMSSWYVNVQKIKANMAENNLTIRWIPDHIQQGQMGKGIESAPDWSISRNRFWGTPIPIWKSASGKIHVCGSIEEIEKLSGVKVPDLHRPFIDSVVLKIDGEEYHRIEDVFDCWFESGSMPYAQVHYPFENKAWFEENFPADFITEYIAQTRGWFYTLQVLSAALFGKAPFKNVICHGVVIDEETGLKYSKRLKNYKDPKEVMDAYGADALRWMMLASPVMRGADLGVDPDGKFIRDVVRLNIKPIWSAYNFFTLYANADGVKAKEISASENMLDRYILAKCKAAVMQVDASFAAYDTPSAAEAITGFFEVLNNWYIRRSRPRFWAEEMTADKQAAYDTLFTVLTLMCQAAAPLLPFTAEAIYRGLHGHPPEIVKDNFGLPLAGGSACGAAGAENEKGVNGAAAVPPASGRSNPPTRIWEGASVHLTDFPEVGGIDSAEQLIRQMDWVQDVCNAASAVRNKQNIRNRQPLSSLNIVGHNPVLESTEYANDALLVKDWVMFQEMIKEEINVKKIESTIFPEELEKIADLKLQINSAVLGKRLPAKMKEILPASKKGQWSRMSAGDVAVAGEPLLPNEYEVKLEPKPEYKDSAAPLSTNDALVILDLTITPELEAEGRARDLVRMIQQARKDVGFNVGDRITLAVDVPADFKAALATHGEYIAAQTLAVSITEGSASAKERVTQELDGAQFTIGLSKVA